MQPAIGSNKPDSVPVRTSLDRCLVDGDKVAVSSGRRRRGKALGISFAIETAALVLLVISPLLTSVAQPNFSRSAVVQYVFGAAHSQNAAKRPPTPTLLPSTKKYGGITYSIGQPPHQPIHPPEVEVDNVIPGGNIFSGPAMPDASQIMDLQPLGPVKPPRDETTRTEEKRPLKLSEPVVQAQLISRIEPRYPILARQTRTEGTVRLRAIISRDGRITALEVLSGHPLFVQAALDAVRQWRYRPTMLNGEPVEVETSITVIFRLE
jgi:periplasmic protein TonB